jgi:hypothetical protein
VDGLVVVNTLLTCRMVSVPLVSPLFQDIVRHSQEYTYRQ